MDYDKLHDLVDCELDKISAKPELNDSLLANLYKLVDIKKDLFEIEEMEMGGDNQSGNSYRYGGSYRGGGNRGYSRRGSNMNYRYDNGYSMDNDNSSYAHLEEAMKHASSDQEREAIRKLINQNYR